MPRGRSLSPSNKRDSCRDGRSLSPNATRDIAQLKELLIKENPAAASSAVSLLETPHFSTYFLRTQAQVYGEILDGGIDMMLQDVPLGQSDVFYDLGSGIGNVCQRVYEKTSVQRSIGVELRADLYKVSALSATEDAVSGRRLQFICGDFNAVDFSDATVVFMNDVDFTPVMHEIILQRLAVCSALRAVVSLQGFCSAADKLVTEAKLNFSHKRKGVPVSFGSNRMTQYSVYLVSSDSM
jgi:SAM-dependent methyltransferase